MIRFGALLLFVLLGVDAANAAWKDLGASFSIGPGMYSFQSTNVSTLGIRSSLDLTYKFSKRFQIGISNDFHYQNYQITAYSEAVGSHTGTHWNAASPMISFEALGVVLKMKYHLLGSYSYAQKTEAGDSLQLGSLSGYGVELNFQKLLSMGKWKFGFFYDQYQFKKVKEGSQVTTGSGVKTSSMGIHFTRSFGSSPGQILSY